MNVIIRREFLSLNKVLRKLEAVRSISSLLEDKAFVDGKWIPSTTGTNFPVHNPSDGSFLLSVPDMNETDTQSAIEVASKAFKTWKETTGKERSIVLRNFFNKCNENQDELAKILTLEQGKPLAEAKGEILYGNSYLEWFSEEARRAYGDVVPSPDRKKEFILVREPIGVAAMITPWNFPNAMLARKVGAALASGCTCVVKPSPDTPLSALAFASLAKEAGVPDGVINVVTTSQNLESVSNALCSSNVIKALSFTGSTRVGKLLYNQCSSTVKKLSLELGGNAAFIVFDSAEIDNAVKGLMASKFRNAGQTCVSSNRIFLQSGIYETFLKKLEASMKKDLVLGDGMCSGVNQGPLINERQIQNIEDLVSDALNKGAEIATGGSRGDSGSLFYEPTIIKNVKPDMRIFHEEIFGPVVSIIQFNNEEEVIELANDTQVGLAGYFYSNDIKQCWRVARKMETGMVGVNEGAISAPEITFGGVKESGIGREGSKYGLLSIRYITRYKSCTLSTDYSFSQFIKSLRSDNTCESIRMVDKIPPQWKPLKRDVNAEIRCVFLTDSETERRGVFDAVSKNLSDGQSEISNFSIMYHHWEQPHFPCEGSDCRYCLRNINGKGSLLVGGNDLTDGAFFRFSIGSTIFRLMLLSKDKQNLLKIITFDFVFVGIQVTDARGNLEESIWEFEWKRLERLSKKAVSPLIIIGYFRDIHKLTSRNGNGSNGNINEEIASNISIEKTLTESRNVVRKAGKFHKAIPRFVDFVTGTSSQFESLFREIDKLYKHPGYILRQCALINNLTHWTKILENPELTFDDLKYSEGDDMADNALMIAAKLRHKDLVSAVLRSNRLSEECNTLILSELIHLRNCSGQTLLAMVALQGPELEEQKLLILRTEIQVHCVSDITHEADQLKLQRCLRGQLKSSAEAAIILEQSRALQGIPKNSKGAKSRTWKKLMGETINRLNSTCGEESDSLRISKIVRNCNISSREPISIQCLPSALSPESKFAKGAQRAAREKKIETSEVLYSTARVMEVSLESSFQPTIQLYIIFPVLMRTMTAQSFSLRIFTVCKMDNLNFPMLKPDQTISIITSILSLAWCFTFYHATLKRGALDKDLAALFYRALIFDIIFVSENVVLLVIALTSDIKELQENRVTFAVVLLGFTLVGLILKCVYYRYLHIWAWLIMDYITKKEDGHWKCILFSNMYFCGTLRERELQLCFIPRPIFNAVNAIFGDRHFPLTVLTLGILVLVIVIILAVAFMPFFVVTVLPCIIVLKCRKCCFKNDNIIKILDSDEGLPLSEKKNNSSDLSNISVSADLTVSLGDCTDPIKERLPQERHNCNIILEQSNQGEKKSFVMRYVAVLLRPLRGKSECEEDDGQLFHPFDLAIQFEQFKILRTLIDHIIRETGVEIFIEILRTTKIQELDVVFMDLIDRYPVAAHALMNSFVSYVKLNGHPVLKKIAASENNELLRHPLPSLGVYLSKKWKDFKLIYYLGFIFQIVAALCVTGYALVRKNDDDTGMYSKIWKGFRYVGIILTSIRGFYQICETEGIFLGFVFAGLLDEGNTAMIYRGRSCTISWNNCFILGAYIMSEDGTSFSGESLGVLVIFAIFGILVVTYLVGLSVAKKIFFLEFINVHHSSKAI
ncbi:ALDH5A1 [Lepeophtheirus salmonis]|uniref:ALDH5A1 n=1 Tax=Lepeophtheirus salmonis TaxID=72036 RepID=A0A7R8CYP0_LEPSM|nr:ALDH5A1 [Lepeophtheirus salmonis]CAF2970009.1 ALDH5A1 [Lepeophtheirus salmonis]